MTRPSSSSVACTPAPTLTLCLQRTEIRTSLQGERSLQSEDKEGVSCVPPVPMLPTHATDPGRHARGLPPTLCTFIGQRGGDGPGPCCPAVSFVGVDRSLLECSVRDLTSALLTSFLSLSLPPLSLLSPPCLRSSGPIRTGCNESSTQALPWKAVTRPSSRGRTMGAVSLSTSNGLNSTAPTSPTNPVAWSSPQARTMGPWTA